MRVVIIFVLMVISASCSSQKNKSDKLVENKNDTLIALEQIEKLDAELKKVYSTPSLSEIPTELIDKTIQAHKDFVFKYPTHSFTPEALDKIHQLYGQLGNYQQATEYGEMILEKYPNYSKINAVIYSLATSYDFFTGNKKKAIVMYELSLSRKDVTENTRKEITERLKQLKQ